MKSDVNGIHLFQALDKYYAFDLFRLQTYQLSKEAFDILRKALNNTYCPDNGIAPEIMTDARKRQSFQTYVDSIMLNIIEDCNFSCTYCFAQQGLYGRTRGKQMAIETGKAAVDWLITKSGDRKNLSICFFGGEPLLNLKLVQSLVPYADQKAAGTEKKIAYTMTTNASLLDDETLKILDELHIKVQVSLDGIGIEHDIHRKFKNGKGTWKTISNNIGNIFANGRKVTVRTTLATGNVRAGKIVDDLLEYGFNHVFLCPATGTDGGALTKEEVSILNQEMELLAQRYLDTAYQGKVMNGFLNLHQKVRRLWDPRFNLSGCGAGKHYFTVGADGDIYACHQLVRPDSSYRLGNVITGEFNDKIQKLFQTITVDDKLDCSKCWARYLCANHCSAKNIKMGSDFDRCDPDFCSVEMKTWELAIALVAQLKQENIRLFEDDNYDMLDDTLHY